MGVACERGDLRRRWWWTWSWVEGAGPQKLARLEAVFGSLAAAWFAPAELLLAVPGIGPEFLAARERSHKRFGAELLPLACPARVLLPFDRALPSSLGQLQRPPLGLHWRGRGSIWAVLRQRRAVAVIGTRGPSLHGLSWARRLGTVLASAGWPVVSGLAEGIDAEVHRGCLEAGGAPVAVLATPLARVYPRHHGQLQEAVAQAGLLISEHGPGAVVQRGHFAARNRLLVSLAQAVVVVECPDASGALHGARLAWTEQLPLWVVPADTDRCSAKGSNRLLAQGATPLLEPADLLASLGEAPFAPLGQRAQHQPSQLISEGSAADSLLKALGAGASLEQLGQRLKQPLPKLAERLMQLELAGVVEPAPGLCWRPSHNGAA